METFFNIRYEFDKAKIWRAIDNKIIKKTPAYICVCDGNILTLANKKPEYLKVVNNAIFSICDSSYIPIYLKQIHKIHRKQYSGSEIFDDAINSRKYKMCFLGAKLQVLESLRSKLTKTNPKIAEMYFESLPFLPLEEFDYRLIAKRINHSGSDIIWVALDAPKQEIFMSNLLPFLDSGVMIGVGAVFNFRSGLGVKRAPGWMIKSHLEFAHRIITEPKKQIARCKDIILNLPRIIREERKRKNP